MKEIERVLQVEMNPKHRTLLMTTYAAGLRVSEVTRLKIKDIESQRNLIRVDQGKGKKDRYTVLSPRLLEELRSHYTRFRPQEWLFNGADITKPLSRSAAQQIYYKAKKKAGITKGGGIHCLFCYPYARGRHGYQNSANYPGACLLVLYRHVSSYYHEASGEDPIPI